MRRDVSHARPAAPVVAPFLTWVRYPLPPAAARTPSEARADLPACKVREQRTSVNRTRCVQPPSPYKAAALAYAHPSLFPLASGLSPRSRFAGPQPDPCTHTPRTLERWKVERNGRRVVTAGGASLVSGRSKQAGRIYIDASDCTLGVRI